MKGLMSRMQNEKGNTLLLVLFLVFLLSAISAPLLLSLSQGNVNNKKGERTEQAQYAAESGMAIVKRVMEEAFYREKMDLTDNQINKIINYVNDKRGSLIGKASIDADFSSGKININAISEAGSIKQSRSLSMDVQITVGSIPTPGILGDDVISKLRLTENKDKSFVVGTGIMQPYIENYDREFRNAFESLMSNQPLYSQYTFPPTNQNCSKITGENVNQTVFCNGNDITIKNNNTNKAVTIYTDVITLGNINIETQYPVIVKNMVAGGSINFTSSELQLKVEGSMISNSNINMQSNIKSLEVTGDISANKSMQVNTINGSFKVGGSIYVSGALTFKSLFAMNIKENILSRESFTVSENNNGSNSLIEGGILTLGDLFFNEINGLVVKKTVGALGKVTINRANGSNTIFGGLAIGQGSDYQNYIVPNHLIVNSSPKIQIKYNPIIGATAGERKLIFLNWNGSI